MLHHPGTSRKGHLHLVLAVLSSLLLLSVWQHQSHWLNISREDISSEAGECIKPIASYQTTNVICFLVLWAQRSLKNTILTYQVIMGSTKLLKSMLMERNCNRLATWMPIEENCELWGKISCFMYPYVLCKPMNSTKMILILIEVRFCIVAKHSQSIECNP